LYLVCYTEYKQISGVKYNVGAANLNLMNETLQSVDWNSTLSSLDVNDSWVVLKQFIRILLIDVFLCTKQNKKEFMDEF